MRQLTAPGGAIPAARFWTRSLSEYRGAPRLPRGAPSVGGRGAPRLRRGATSVCGSRRATASPGRDERWGSRRATASPGRPERWRSRRATASPGRDERWGGWGAISGAPMSLELKVEEGRRRRPVEDEQAHAEQHREAGDIRG